jgi:hypothetical protein
LSVPQVLDAKRDMEDCQLQALSRKMQFQLLKLKLEAFGFVAFSQPTLRSSRDLGKS